MIRRDYIMKKLRESVIVPWVLACVFAVVFVVMLVFAAPRLRVDANAFSSALFVRVAEDISFDIYEETRTGVLYAVYRFSSSVSITVMLDTDGSPLTREKWELYGRK
jgi:hypothetical protein